MSGTITSILTPTTSFRSTFSSHLDSLYEFKYLSNDEKIPLTYLPLINPYKAFTKPSHSLTKTVKCIVSPSRRYIKEYVQACH